MLLAEGSADTKSLTERELGTSRELEKVTGVASKWGRRRIIMEDKTGEEEIIS